MSQAALGYTDGMSEGPKPNPACSQCGNTAFDIGIARAAYMPDPEGKFKGLFSPLAKGETIRARKCRSCGHLVMFATGPIDSQDS